MITSRSQSVLTLTDHYITWETLLIIRGEAKFKEGTGTISLFTAMENIRTGNSSNLSESSPSAWILHLELVHPVASLLCSVLCFSSQWKYHRMENSEGKWVDMQ